VNKKTSSNRRTEILGSNSKFSVRVLKLGSQEKDFPALKKLGTYMIAVNNEYAGEQKTIKPTDEVAIIPPVSGG